MVLKISGEALAGGKHTGYDFDFVISVVQAVKKCMAEGVQVGIVIGGGNFWRGVKDGAGLVGRTPGGPAKVSVIASAMMGMINGSAIANVATTGTITIPLMKKTGYRKEFAGAVEAVASTGGQFTPPIMGAVGFVMAEFMAVSYTKVMLAAAIPAVLYFVSLLWSVHLEADSKHGRTEKAKTRGTVEEADTGKA